MFQMLLLFINFKMVSVCTQLELLFSRQLGSILIFEKISLKFDTNIFSDPLLENYCQKTLPYWECFNFSVLSFVKQIGGNSHLSGRKKTLCCARILSRLRVPDTKVSQPVIEQRCPSWSWDSGIAICHLNVFMEYSYLVRRVIKTSWFISSCLIIIKEFHNSYRYRLCNRRHDNIFLMVRKRVCNDLFLQTTKAPNDLACGVNFGSLIQGEESF